MSVDMGDQTVINVADPVNDQDAATKAHVASQINANNGQFLRLDGSSTMTGNIDAGGNKLIDLDTPVISTDGATKGYVDSKAATLGVVGSPWIIEDLNYKTSVGSSSGGGHPSFAIANLVDNTWTLTTGGNGGSTPHGLHIYQQVSGDFTLVAKIIQSTARASDQAIRIFVENDVTNYSSGVVDICIVPNQNTGPNPYTILTETTTTGGSYTSYWLSPAVQLPLPIWLKLERSGNTITTGYSTNGTTFTTHETFTTSTNFVGSTAYVGIHPLRSSSDSSDVPLVCKIAPLSLS